MLPDDLEMIAFDVAYDWPASQNNAQLFCDRENIYELWRNVIISDLLSSSSEVVQPFIMGCDSKNSKMVHISLTAIQRMIQHEVISAVSNNHVSGVVFPCFRHALSSESSYVLDKMPIAYWICHYLLKFLSWICLTGLIDDSITN